jgi:DNA polymerase III gamma/tau subunit
MLHESYRPKDWSEFVGHEQTVKRVRAVIGRPSFNGGALWISGPSGCGKTTLAKIIATSLGASDFDITELDGTDG